MTETVITINVDSKGVARATIHMAGRGRVADSDQLVGLLHRVAILVGSDHPFGAGSIRREYND